MLSRILLYRIIFGAILFLVGMFVVNRMAKDPEVINKVMSYDEENQLGEQIYQEQIASGSQGQLLTDPYLDSVLGVIMHRITDQLDSIHYDYSVQIINSDQVNAFTIPGGKMFYYSAMFGEIENPEECAAILAHEVGHNENRDVVRKLIQSYGLTALVAINPTLTSQVINSLNQLKFAREEEDEADHFAYKTMVKAGLHPKYFAYVMEEFEELEQTQGGAVPEILSDHPNSAKRKQEAINYPVPADFKEVPFDIDWDEFQTRLAAVKSAQDSANAAASTTTTGNY